MCAAPATSPQLRDVVDGLLADLPALADDLAVLLAGKDRFYRRVNELAPSRFRRACAAHLRQVLTGVADGVPGPAQAACQAALDRVALGAPVDSLLGAVRVFGCFVHAAALRRLSGSDDPEPSVLLQLASRIGASVDAYADLLAHGYGEMADAARLAALDGLFSGWAEPGLDLPATAFMLGLPPSGVFAVVAAESGAAARADGWPWPTAWRPGTDVDIGIIALDGVAELASVRRALADIASEAGLSALFDDLADAPDAVRQARIARQGLVGTTAAERETLLATLRVWLDSGGVDEQAAARLSVHQDLVRHRLRRVQELIGRSQPDIAYAITGR